MHRESLIRDQVQIVVYGKEKTDAEPFRQPAQHKN
jgi:hypothetical protein